MKMLLSLFTGILTSSFIVYAVNLDDISGDGDRRLDISNSTDVDNDYGYFLGTVQRKSNDNSALASDNNEQDIIINGDDQQPMLLGCVPLIIPNGFIKNGDSNRPSMLSIVKYSCNEKYADVGQGILRCIGLRWSPSPNEVCKRMCPRLVLPDVFSTHLELDDTASTITDPVTAYFTQFTKLRIVCRSPDYRAKYRQNTLKCGNDGRWKLMDGDIQIREIHDGDELCEQTVNDIPLAPTCSQLPYRSGLKIRYKMQQDDGMISMGDEAIITCALPNYVIRMREHSTQAIFRCLATGQWSHQDQISSLTCVPTGCPRAVSDLQLKPAYEWQATDSTSHHQIYVDDSATTVRQDVRVFYTCDDPEHYYLVGEKEYTCGPNGSWTPPYWPRCERKGRCSALEFPSDGYYNSNPNSDGFAPGHVVNFGCADGFRLEGRSDLKCLDSGEWNGRSPTCVRDEWSTKRFIAVTSVACLLGVLLVVILGFFLQRQLILRKALGTARRHRLLDSGGSEPRLRFASMNSGSSVIGRGHHPNSQMLAAAARTGPAAFDSDPDRLALIAFADGIQVPLPSYEEAVSQAINERRCHPPPFDAISTLSGYCSRAVRRLPSLSSLRSSRDGNVGNGPPGSPRNRTAASGNGAGAQRSRLREQWSSTSGSNVSSHSHGQNSRHVGSNDTMAVSDVSTNVTLETVSTGGQSQSASARAYAGSLSSILSSTGGGNVPTTSIPIVALSVCSASSMASSIGGTSTSSAGPSSAIGGSQSEGLPLLESQELDGNQDDYEDGYSNDGQQQLQAVDNSDEICSQKSLET